MDLRALRVQGEPTDEIMFARTRHTLRKISCALARMLGREKLVLESPGEPGEFLIYKYKNRDGSFDYEKYKDTQIDGNRRKIGKIFVSENNISFLADYIKSVMGGAEFGLCHGTRRGLEQQWFQKYFDCKALGTEISDAAEDFPATICWDFHDTKPEWIDSVDFIYSNSLDHSYDPENV